MDGLDALLCGGFLQGDTVLLAGAPGSGKTSLGMQFLHYGATVAGEPGCLLTFEEFPDRIYRDGEAFGWDLRGLEREGLLQVIFTAPDVLYQDLMRHDGLVPTLVRDLGARRLVVDSVTHFRRLAPDREAFRELLSGVLNAFKREGLTSLFIRELADDESAHREVEDYIADAVIHLTHQRVEGQRVRFLEIIKSRGTASHPSRSLLLIGDDGLRVVPPFRPPAYALADAAATGLGELDAVLGGGVPYGSVYLVEASPARPRNLLEINFLHTGLAAGERAVNLQAPGQHANGVLARDRRLGWAGAFERAQAASRYLPAVLNGHPAESSAARPGDTLRGELRTRAVVNLNDLRGAVGAARFLSVVRQLNDDARTHTAALLACVNPRTVTDRELDELRDLAGGIIRVRHQCAYHFLQVCKSVPGAVTDWLPLVELDAPPFLHLSPY